LSVALATALTATPALAGPYPTIVGSWYAPGQQADCTTYWGVHIEPMGILNGEMRCDFNSVRRDGWKVTWTGQCLSTAGDARNISVVALETNGTLDISFSNGGVISDLKRCPK
jgi:hypothetical protein